MTRMPAQDVCYQILCDQNLKPVLHQTLGVFINAALAYEALKGRPVARMSKMGWALPILISPMDHEP